MFALSNKKFSTALAAGLFAAALAAGPSNVLAGEILATFEATSPLGNTGSYLDLDFTLRTTDYVVDTVSEPVGTNSDGSSIMQNFGAYRILEVWGTLTKKNSLTNAVLLSATIANLKPIGTSVGSNYETNNDLFPVLVDPITNFITGSDLGPAALVDFFAFDASGFAFDLIGSNTVLAQLTADVSNYSLYVLSPASYLDATGGSIVLLGSNPTPAHPFGQAGPTNFVFSGVTITEVPAPAPLALLGLGLLGIGYLRRSRTDESVG
jgi:hypothetical protein